MDSPCHASAGSGSDPIAVLEVFVHRFSPQSWSGSRAAIVELRIRLLDSLETHSNPAIANFVKEKRPQLEEEVARERKWETRRDQERDERFE